MKRTVLFALSAAALAACGPAENKQSEQQAAPAAPPAAPPAPARAGPLPAAPAWASGYMGKVVTELLPEKAACVGNTEAATGAYAGPPAGLEVVGWGYDKDAGRRVERVLIVDESLRVVGAGESGIARSDVPQSLPEVKDANTGWKGYAAITTGDVLAFGLVDNGQGLCLLGRIRR